LGKECGKYLRAIDGIFCANSLSRHGQFAPCKGAWCGPCYKPLGEKIFAVKVLLDDDGEELVDPSESSRFKEARAGDHLMTPFQCKLCHFRNIMARNPVMSHAKDRAIWEFSRQANLDAFWCRAKSTVASNLWAGLQMEKTADNYGMPSIVPQMGPLPLDDSVGMKAAIAVLDRSLDSGVYSECVRWGTFRKTRSAITNISVRLGCRDSKIWLVPMRGSTCGFRRLSLISFGSLLSSRASTFELVRFENLMSC
jgi:hypothetical protein